MNLQSLQGFYSSSPRQSSCPHPARWTSPVGMISNGTRRRVSRAAWCASFVAWRTSSFYWSTKTHASPSSSFLSFHCLHLSLPPAPFLFFSIYILKSRHPLLIFSNFHSHLFGISNPCLCYFSGYIFNSKVYCFLIQICIPLS